MASEREVLVLQLSPESSGLRIWNNQRPDWLIVRHSSLETAGLYLNGSGTSVGIVDCRNLKTPNTKLKRWLDNYQGVFWIAIVSQGQLLQPAWQLFVAMHCYDYHTAPVLEELLSITIGRAYGMSRIRNNLSLSFKKFNVVGHHEEFQNILIYLQNHQGEHLTISGEPGTGKSLLAKCLSEMKGFQFLEIDISQTDQDNCISHFDAAVSNSLSKPTCLYLRNIDFISEKLQKHITKSGITENLKLIFSCSLDPDSLDNSYHFTPEFSILLRKSWIKVPALRERGQDKTVLAKHYLYKISRTHGKYILGFTNEAESAIDRHSWPGNITELVERIKKGVADCNTDYLSAELIGLEGSLVVNHHNLSLRKAREEADALAIERVLDLVSGSTGRAAELLCISRASLHRLIARYGIRR
ncbi:VpsR-related response regulator [Zobellella sp. An-6]|uniref:VpsR-related response regulator n=1 Tax=Zobellella sp. An-6 TaxID=3400218 RepID=UPI004041952A